MTNARLFLSGIAASGRHGARPGEKDEPQDFVVDLDLEVSVDADTIGATADYRIVSDVVRHHLDQVVRTLRDHGAHDVAERVLALDHVTRVTAIVHKPGAARRLGIDGVASAVTLPPDAAP